MITEKDIGKKCRLISHGEIGRRNIEDRGSWRLNNVYEITGIKEDEYDTYVQISAISPRDDSCISLFSWRLELCGNAELEALT